MKRKVVVLGGALGFFILDRLIKSWAVQAEPVHGFFISWGYVLNSGGVFSTPVPQWALVLGATLALTCLVALGLQAWKKERLQLFSGVSLMLVGGMSNLLDRLLGAGVVDVFTLIGGLSFNLADTYLVAGLLLIIL